MTLDATTYRPRIIDALLMGRLESAGAVVIEGAKATGKTATARRHAASASYLDTDPQIKQLLELDPALVLEGARPRLLDEWQLAPELWNHVRRAIDDSLESGQFILTGSATPADDITRHSGAGRFSRIRMRPFTMFESGESSGRISIRSLLAGEAARAPDDGTSLTALVERMAKGGMPAASRLNLGAAQRFNTDYLDQMSRLDLSGNGHPQHDPEKVRRLMRSLARNTATEATIATLVRDTSGEEGNIARTTVERYLDSLKRVFMLEEQPAWSPRLRSAATLRKAPKRHLSDVALAIAAIGATPDRLLRDPNTLGFMFESFVHQQLLVYGQPADLTVHHYRDSNGLEVDAIMQAPSGEWLAVEVKLGPAQVDAAAANLQRFRDTVQGPTPSAMVVVVPTGFAYRRSDGVDVVPITHLGP